MRFADVYLAKQGNPEKIIQTPPAQGLKYIAVIPAYNESGLITSLDSLFNCTRPAFPLEVIVVINWPLFSESKIIEQNLEIKKEAEQWALERNDETLSFHFFVAEPEDEKRSGVGFARKKGMDEAIQRFAQLNRPDGIILSLDADIQVDSNYFTAIENHYQFFPGADGCTIYFEHPADQSVSEEIRRAIVQYELHQRYYIQSLRFAGHPNSFHTVGSSFSVRAKAYCQQGGMNLRKAGEDFYFLQKIFDLGNFTECNSTCVYPSPRPSMRVPFGTGAVIFDSLKSKKPLLTFNFKLFILLKTFIDNTEDFYKYTAENDFSFLEKLDPLIREYLIENSIKERLREIYANSSDKQSFQKRFFRWFNMFRMLKFLNTGKTVYPEIPVRDACIELLAEKGYDGTKNDPESLLTLLRKLDKNNPVNHPLQQ